MSRSYPIWNIVEASDYASGKSYGARDWTKTEVRVGTSAKNSEVLCRHSVDRRPYLGGEWVAFRFEVEDGEGNILATVQKYMHVKSKTWQDVDPGRFAPCPSPDALPNPDFSTNRAREEERRLAKLPEGVRS